MSVEFVGIELELRGADEVYNDLKNIDRVINSLGGKKKLDMGLAQLKRDAVAARGEIEKLKREQENYRSAVNKAQREANVAMNRMNSAFEKFGNAYKNSSASRFLKDSAREANVALAEAKRGFAETSAALVEQKQRYADIQQAQREVSAAAKTMGKTFQQSFNRANSVMTHVGSKMQSLGNAMTRLSSPFQRLTTGLLYGAGYKALNMITEGFSNAFTRADTMNKYVRLMEEYETKAYTAEQSQTDLDASIQGLPIALDEAIALAQRYTLSLGDMERGTKLAIATNNAFLASMATETQRYQGMLQLQDLMNGKDLQPREWMSLGSSMGKAINEIGKELGYGTDELGKFRQELYAGDIATEDFLNALIKVGTGEGKLVGLAKVSAQTWEGLFSNARIAAARMGANIIETLNSTFKKATGRTLLQTLLGLDAQGNEVGGGIKHWINDMSESVQKWIKAHPEEITNFFNDLKAIDWTGLVKGFAQGTLEMVKALTSLTKAFGSGDLSKFGRNMIRMSWLGRGITILGGVLKGTSGLFATIYATTKTLRRAKGAGSLLDAIGVLLGGEDSDIGKATEKMTKAGGSMGKFSLGLSRVFKGWAQLAAMVGGTAFVGMASIKMLKTTIKDLGEIGDLVNEVDWDAAAPALKGFAAFLMGFMTLGSVLGQAGMAAMKPAAIGTAVLGGLTTFLAGVAALDMKLLKSSAKSLADVGKYINSAIDSFKSIKPLPEGVVDKIRDVRGVFNQITDLLQEKTVSKSAEESGQVGKEGLKRLDKNSAKTIKNLASALKNMVSGINSLNAINDAKVNTENIGANLTALSDGVEQIGTLLKKMPEVFQSKESQTLSENMMKSMANVKKAFSSLTGEDGVLALIPQIMARVHSLNLDTVENDFGRLKTALTTISTALEGVGADSTFSDRMNNFRAALKSMKFAIKHLNEIGQMEVNTNGGDNIRTALSQLSNVFDEVGIENITSRINGFVTAIKDALAQFEQFNKTITINTKVKLGSGFNSSVNRAVSLINSARNKIQSAFDSIPTELSKTVNVRITVKTWTSGVSYMENAAQQALTDAGYSATGGMIYRASGGTIPRFRPRGTDTVPAMLTPGEYVHNRRAVNLFGIDFMRKVNSLDMKGAMDELMIRAGNMVGAGQSTTINNYYNNNQKVVQNINTNSPDFAFRTASRFVGAF